MGYIYGGAGKFEEMWQKVRTVFWKKKLTDILFCKNFSFRSNERFVV